MPLIDDLIQKQKPAMIAKINEAECIGCTKCLPVCPTDAIIGAAKLMHTIIRDACTGCELCVAPCPVDCIEMVLIPTPTETEKQINRARWEKRYAEREQRLARDAGQAQQHESESIDHKRKQTLADRRLFIEAAIARVNVKRKTNEPRET